MMVNDRCYQLNLVDKRSWQGASDFCQAQKTELLEAWDKEEYSMLSQAPSLFDKGIDSLWLNFQRESNGYIHVIT